MLDYNPEKPIISLHIPKCAGTTFSDVLRLWFGNGFFENYHNEKLNVPPTKHILYDTTARKQFISGLCVHGHFNNKRKIVLMIITQE